MAYNYQAAIQAGANPNDVINYMASQTGYKAQDAVQAGANPQDVMSYMANLPQQGQNGNGGTDTTTPTTTKLDTPTIFANGLQSLFPNQNIGKIIGSPIGALMTAVTDPKDLKYYDWNPHASAAGVAADIGGDALNAASLLAAPESGGTSLLARSGVNAAIGGGLNLANSLSNGQSITDPGVIANAAGSATLSSLFPLLSKIPEGFMGAAKSAAGIDDQIATELRKATPQEVQENIQAVLAHNKDLSSPTAQGVVAKKVNEATDVITQKLKTAGQAVGDAVKQTGSRMIGTNPQTGSAFTDDILSSFNKKVEDTFGHEISYTPEDTTKLIIGGDKMTAQEPLTEPVLKPLEGRSRTIISADQNRMLQIHSQIMDLAENPTVAKASDVIHNLDDLIDYSKVDQVGINHDPLQGIIRSTRGEINGAIRTTSPEIAAANDRFSHLKDIENEIGEKAGSDLHRAGLVMKRVFSGDQASQNLELLEKIKKETGIDLVKHSALAKFATDNFGNASSKSLLQQELNEGGSMLGGMKKAIMTPIKNITRAALVPNTTKYAMKIANGGKYANMLDELLNSPGGRGLMRTYFNNVSAAHPQIGKGLDRGLANLIGNTTGI